MYGREAGWGFKPGDSRPPRDRDAVSLQLPNSGCVLGCGDSPSEFQPERRGGANLRQGVYDDNLVPPGGESPGETHWGVVQQCREQVDDGVRRHLGRANPFTGCADGGRQCQRIGQTFQVPPTGGGRHKASSCREVDQSDAIAAVDQAPGDGDGRVAGEIQRRRLVGA